ncbi:MAG: T9SS type A sorting domain-containing protein, partial [Muribaculaceae bacterium]|nr:T9SS type A sorting domain-containing protein [Muribaculaceae bacterium]
TDTGDYGANTPLYFCLDKLCVTPAAGSAAGIVAADRVAINYDRSSKTVTLTGADFAAVYDALGAKVMQSDDKSFSIASLPAGVYVVKAGNSSIKIIR